MTKQTIEIDVPEGCEYTGIDYAPSRWTEEGECIEVTMFLMKKEPEFIEVREYIFKNDNVAMIGILNKSAIHTTGDIEEMEGFVSWRDKEWRKVEI